MTSCPEAIGSGFGNLKKNSELRFGLGRSKSIFGARRGQIISFWRGAACGGVRWKCQHRKKLCLSLLMSKNIKLKKVNKSFVLEPIPCFSDSYMRMNIMNFLCMWISWSYFWTWVCYNSIVVVGALTRCSLLHSVFYLKAAEMNVQLWRFRKRVYSEFVNPWNWAKTFSARNVKANRITET